MLYAIYWFLRTSPSCALSRPTTVSILLLLEDYKQNNADEPLGKLLWMISLEIMLD